MLNDKVQWLPIEFGEGRFSVSSQGWVRNNDTGLFLSFQVQNSGYSIVHLHYKGVRKAFTVHRLVACAFIPKIDGKCIVDHIDCNKRNNAVDNLRWSTGHENMTFASQNGLLKNSGEKARERMRSIGSVFGFENSQKNLVAAKQVILTIDGSKVKFRSLREAAKHVGVDHKTLANRIKKGLYK